MTNATNYKILRCHEMTNRIGVSRSTIYDWMKPESPRFDSSFPKPVKLGKSSVGWIESDLNRWLELRIQKSLENTNH